MDLLSQALGVFYWWPPEVVTFGGAYLQTVIETHGHILNPPIWTAKPEAVFLFFFCVFFTWSDKLLHKFINCETPHKFFLEIFPSAANYMSGNTLGQFLVAFFFSLYSFDQQAPKISDS